MAMNDPHVKALYYRVVPGKGVDYNKAPPVFEETDEFKLSIDGKTAVFKMKQHYSTANEAKTVIDKYLRAWDILIGLDYDPDELQLRFDHADIIDRLPSKIYKNIVNLHVHNLYHTHVLDSVSLHVSRGKYPSFPKNFIASPDAETMYLRYKAYRQNRENLTSMAYMCLTVLEASAGNGGKKRANAATKYNIDYSVLDTLGKLSEKGDAKDARKVPKNGSFKPLSQVEKEWIVSVIKALIKRAGEYVYNPAAKLQGITMNNFPQLAP